MTRMLFWCIVGLALSRLAFIYGQDSALLDILKELQTQADVAQKQQDTGDRHLETNDLVQGPPFEDTATDDGNEGTASDSDEMNLTDPLNITPGDETTEDIENDLADLLTFDTDKDEKVRKGYVQDLTAPLRDDSADPCYEHDVLSCIDQSMRFDNHSVIKCDKRSGWFRFMGDAGSQMATSCVPVHHCGTEAPGWLNGQHPSSPGEEVTARVCYHWEDDCCKFEALVMVRDCDGFYVYKLLKLPGNCALRVCSNGALIATNIPSSTQETTTTSEPSTTQEPTTTSKPTSTEEPTTTSKPTITEEPTTTSKPSTTQEPTTTSKPTSTEEPTTTSKPTITQEITTTSKPTTTEEPTTTSKPTTTQETTTTSKPTATQETTTSSKPTTTHKHTTTSLPSTTIKSTTTSHPTKIPSVTQEASTTAFVEITTETPTTIGEECSNYKVLDSPDRAMTFFHKYILKCDKTLDVGWYRFQGAAGTRMPTLCVPHHLCGTHASGWLSGGHPSVQQGIVSRKVCFHWMKNCCRYSSNIRVRNCSDFYVYELKPPSMCHLRYCGNGAAARPECSTYKILNDSDRSVLYTAGMNNSKCDKYIVPGWYRFVGPAGNKMPEQAPPKLYCGAHAPGWLKGRHPRVVEGSVIRTVCYNWNNNKCQWNNEIKVTNCGGFYVYDLVGPPVCRLRYCVVGAGPTSQPTTIPTPAQCHFYKPLKEGDRAINHKSDRQNAKCDNKIVLSWYRFVGPAGNHMPETAPAIYHCGTRAPGWLDGKHPSTAKSTVKQRVCYRWKKNVCRWSNDILVTNCGDYYVYKLGPTPGCNLRYCGVGLALPLEPECTSYTELNEKDRSVDFTATKFTAKCDRRLVTKWYRISGEAGDQMPNNPPPIKSCGTLAPGWLKGKHPSEEEGRVTRQVCYTWRNKICRWNNSIQVTNCGDYFVYQLSKPPTCRLRYCGVSKALPNKDECKAYTVLDEKDRSVGFTATKFTPKCDKRLTTKWYRFTGAAGNQMANLPPPVKSCGTHAPGWLSETHPTVADGRVTRKVCFNWKGDKCFWSTSVQVTNCGSYFVYKLNKPPACRLRYCGIKGSGLKPSTFFTSGPTNPTTAATMTPTTSVTILPDMACSNFKVMNEFDRSENYNYKGVKGGRPKCDGSLAHAWYRFKGRAGTRMSDKCVPYYRCGTDAPGWLDGTHPSVQEGVVLREVCFNFRGNCCKWSSQIEVRNCGAFYVYRIDGTPACDFRYCGNGKSGFNARWWNGDIQEVTLQDS